MVFVTEQGLRQGSQFIYSKLALSVISCWTTIISWLSKMRWIFLSLSLGIFLSDNKAFTLNFTSMVEVTDCLSSFFCDSLPTSAALAALTPSFAALVYPVENDTSNHKQWNFQKSHCNKQKFSLFISWQYNLAPFACWWCPAATKVFNILETLHEKCPPWSARHHIWWITLMKFFININHVVILHPECRCSSSLTKPLKGFFQILGTHKTKLL